MAFAPRRRVRRLRSYLRAERRTLRQGLAALVVGTVAALVAGVALGSIEHTLEELPGLFIMIPAVLSMRGTIFGAMGARLGTATHAGLFEVTAARTGVLYQNVYVGIVLVLFSSLYLAVLAKASAVAFGLESMAIIDFITIAVVGGVIDSSFLLVLTVGLAVLSYRRGYDLDAVATPIITAIADMLTVPALFLATFVTDVRALTLGIAIAAVVVCLGAAVRGITTRLRMARRIVLEMAAVVLLTPVLDILAGTAIEARIDRFQAFPGLLVIIPAFVANAGSLGGILSSRLSSKLQLGVIRPRLVPEPAARLDVALVVGFSIVVFMLTGVLGLGYSEAAGESHPGTDMMVWGTLVAGLLATGIAIVVSYLVAIVTSRVGLDPDNHSVPIITSVMDLAGVLVFLLVLSWFGVGVAGGG
jgi:mgtE-like transporter